MNIYDNQVAPAPFQEAGEEETSAPSTDELIQEENAQEEMGEDQEEKEFGPAEESDTEEQEKSKKDPIEKFHKRVNKLVAQRNSALDEVEALKAKVEKLENRKADNQEVDVNSIKSEIAKVRGIIESGDYTHKDIVYLDQLRDLYTEKLVNQTKESALDDINKKEEQVKAVQKEWTDVVKEYGEYGIEDTNSNLFRLAKLYYEHPSTKGKYVGSGAMRLAVADAFRDLVTDGDIMTKKPLSGNNQKELKENRKKALSTGGSSAIDSDSTAESEEDMLRDYFSERKKLRDAIWQPPQYQYTKRK